MVNHRGYDTKAIKAFGETKSLIAWSRDLRCRVSYATLRIRLYYAHENNLPDIPAIAMTAGRGEWLRTLGVE